VTNMFTLFDRFTATFMDVCEEIASARKKHGPQKHLPLINAHAGRGEYHRAAQSYKDAWDRASEDGTTSWDIILLEEVFEALEALQNGDLVEARGELVQVMAMATSMLELVDEKLADEVNEWTRCGQCMQFLRYGKHPAGSGCEHAASNVLEVGSGTCTSTEPAPASTATLDEKAV